jgi:hypothetical protein
MVCAYHTQISAQVHCSNCNRGLCTSCDHRIKGFPYCQDCIVSGIQLLQKSYHQQGNNYQTSYRPKGSSAGKAFLALLFAIFPSGGAIFNRQNLKAVVQFISIFGLFYLGKVSPFFGLAGMAFYFHSVIDSYRTARAIAEGESPSENEERYKFTLIKRAPAIGVALILIGLVVFIHLIHPLYAFISFARLVPVALIILGGYLLTRYFKQSREFSSDNADRKNLYLVTGNYSDRESAKQSSRYGSYR